MKIAITHLTKKQAQDLEPLFDAAYIDFKAGKGKGAVIMQADPGPSPRLGAIYLPHKYIIRVKAIIDEYRREKDA